jgi:hypothetical protein
MTQVLYAKEAVLSPEIICAFDDRTVSIDLNNRLNINEDIALKAEFFYKKNSFGSCLLKITEEFPRKNSKAAFDQIYFEKLSCKFFSEKRSEDIVLVSKGLINYSLLGNGPFYVDLFHNKQPLKCKKKK